MFSDGTLFNVTIPDLDQFMLYNVQICINYAAQLGASLILLIMLAIVTKPDKRRTPIFALNSLSLALNFIRMLLQCLYFTGPFSEVYAVFAGDFSQVHGSAFASSVAATIFTFLLLVCVEASLLFQTHVVCMTLSKLYRRVFLVISASIVSVAIGFRLAVCIVNIKSILELTYLDSLQWLTSATNIATTLSICWFCAIFVTKLGMTIHSRRKMGIRSFGPMQIIFITGCQTLFIPGNISRSCLLRSISS